MLENETLAALRRRRSVRAFQERPVEEAVKEALLDAALQAPTAGCQMLYTVIDVTDQSEKQALSELCDHQDFIARAPVVLIFLADCRRWYDAFEQAGCAPRAPGAGDLLLAAADACIAAQNVVVAAESLGLGSCYIGDILENCAQVRQLLELPAHVVPAAMLVLGYPAPGQMEREKPARFSRRFIVQENRYRTAEPGEFQREQQARSPERSLCREDYRAWMDAFCRRKYNSAFSREMTRSATEYLQEFLADAPEGRR